MQKKLSSSEIEDIIGGKNDQYIINESNMTSIRIENYEFEDLTCLDSIKIPYDLEISNCIITQPFHLIAVTKGKITFSNIRSSNEKSSISLKLECDKLILEGCNISSLIKLESENKIREVAITNTTKSPKLYIEKGEYRDFTISGEYDSIKINHAQFFDFLILEKIQAQTLRINEGIFNNIFKIAESTFTGSIEFQKGNYQEVKICANTFDSFNINGGIFEKEFKFEEKNIFNDICTINGVEFRGEFTINGGEFNKEFKFEGGSKFKNITFTGGYFAKVLFKTGTFDGFISVKGGKYDNITFKGGTFINYVEFWNKKEKDSKEEKLEFKIGKINISGGDFKENIWIKDGEIDEINIRPVLMSRIHILPSDGNKYQFSTPSIKTINITTYFFKDSFLQISDISLKKLSFSNFTNMATITIANVSIKEEIEIINSDLGKTTFIDCDFRNIIFKFKSSKITDSSLNGTFLPKIIIADDNNQKRLVLSQLKKIYENRGNFVTANTYYAREMKTYYTQLTKENFKLSNLPEIFSLCFNQKSNDFGQSWLTAFKFTSITSFFFFIFYTWSLYYTFDWNYFIKAEGYSFLLDFNPFVDNSKYFFEFFNPTHKFDFISEKKTSLSFASGFWDFFSRVFIGYGIYQFIAAFRKHGKKS